MTQKHKENQVLNIQNVTNCLEDVTIENDKKDIPKYWSKEYINKSISNIPEAKYKILFQFLWRTGVRVSECVNVKKKDIDIDKYLITVRWLKNRKYNTRNIPMQPVLRELLSIYLSTFKAEDKIFNYSRVQVWRLTNKFFGDKTHRIRHSFAVNWLNNGGELVQLSRMLGHSDIKTTMKYLMIIPQDIGKELIKINFD